VLGVTLALSASLAWGFADYLGGVKSRVVPLLALIAVSQLAGLTLTAVLAAATGSYPSARTAAYAAIAGAAGVIALAAFYRGMAIGRISIVAPVSATGVVIPVAAGLEAGVSPRAFRWHSRQPSGSASSSSFWPKRAMVATRLRPLSCCG
jgi:uncharacterized membrane protein